MSVEGKHVLKNQKYFVDTWLEDPHFVGWLSKSKITKARHVAPCATKPLNYQQVGDLHLQILLKGKNMVIVLLKGKKSKSFEAFSNTYVSDDNQRILENTLSQYDSSKAEIIWLLKCVMSGCSLRFNDDLGDLCAMYPGVEKLKNFSMARSKSCIV